jgi:segregation and condensation protein B
LLEMQLVRVIGRSELPGRPWMFGTTQKFMEHFGLKSLDDLPGTDELRRLEAEQARARAPKATEPEPPPEDPNQMKIEVVEEHVAAEAAVPDEDVPIEREILSEEEIVGGEEEEEYDDEDDDDDDDEEESK